ncbi:MAG: hypothetical protein IKT98_03075 [Selenomonadaceae bacterium]|nr:hypothetical protein [Selenomonadaceae bacterium]
MNDYDLHPMTAHFGSCMKFEDETRERLKNKKCLEYYGFKVYSQNDEDGIIEEIFNRIGTTNKIFIEFGVENGLECNSHYLLFKNWRGLWIDGGDKHVKKIKEKFAPVIANGQLKVLQAFITRENINELFITGGVTGEIDLLSIDVDGNDYYIWQAINIVKPRVVIVEYNSKFPPNCDWKMAYNKNHIWDGSDWQGASLKAFELLGRKLGYQLVATNFSGVNAFFVRKDLAKDLFIEPATAENLYNPSRFKYVLYQNHHPARYCLAVQKENLGIFNYKPNHDALPLGGFYGESYSENFSFNVMSGKSSSVLVCNKRKVALPYFVLPEDERNVFGVSLKISVGEQIISQFPIQPNGVIEMNLPPSDVPLTANFELSRTFTNTQGKEHGLAIIFEIND